MVQAFMEELVKIATISAISAIPAPSIATPKSPAGDGATTQAKPASPVSLKAITSKALGATNLAKTNYTSASTKVPALDTSQAWSKSIPAPTVRS